MKYVVAVMTPDDLDASEVHYQTRSLVPCANEFEVGIALSVVRTHADDAWDWSIFELVNGHFERRAIVFEPNGTTVREIQ